MSRVLTVGDIGFGDVSLHGLWFGGGNLGMRPSMLVYIRCLNDPSLVFSDWCLGGQALQSVLDGASSLNALFLCTCLGVSASGLALWGSRRSEPYMVLKFSGLRRKKSWMFVADALVLNLLGLRSCFQDVVVCSEGKGLSA